MDSFVAGVGTAMWFGILTSISPCPLATNIAAVSYIGSRSETQLGMFLAGILYMLGRMLTYTALGIALVSSAQSVPMVANFLQTHMNIILGPLLIIIGIFLLDIIKFSIGAGSGSIINKLQGKIQQIGLLGAGLLGILFALSFCPVSAALFFGSLFSVAVKHNSEIIMPSIYGMGTALPVLFFSILMGISTRQLAKALKKVSVFEIYARKITAIVFVIAGIYYCRTYLF